MFGLALRSYQKKVQRLTESETQRDKTLWEAIIDYLREQGGAPRRRIFERFQRDDESAVAAILNDLVSSGLAYSTGRGGSAVFGLTSAVDRERMADEDQSATLPAMLWLVVYREGPLAAAALAERFGLDLPAVEALLGDLERDGRVQRDTDTRLYRSGTMTIAVGDRAGWEAAVLDHFSGVAKAIAAKVRLGPQSELAEWIGGATLSFDVHPGHPLEREVYDLLKNVRASVNDVWHRLAAHNRAHPILDGEKIKVTFYLGQNVERPDPTDAGDRSKDAAPGGAQTGDSDSDSDTAGENDTAESGTDRVADSEGENQS
jgi:hypothetical protein